MKFLLKAVEKREKKERKWGEKRKSERQQNRISEGRRAISSGV